LDRSTAIDIRSGDACELRLAGWVGRKALVIAASWWGEEPLAEGGY